MSINESLLLIAAGVVVAFFAWRAFNARRAANERAEQKAAEEAARAEAQRKAAADAARAEAERKAAAEAAQAEAERKAAEDAARAEAERKAAKEAAQAEADRKTVEEALRLEEEERLAVDEAIARESERQASEDVQRPAAASSATVAPAKTPEETVVMIADDSKVVRVKTGRLLGAQQYQVVMAEDGLDAAQKIASALPDVLITDVDMPGMSGLQLTRQLRASAATARLPIIMVTSDSEQLRAEANAAGVDVLLGKPYPEEQLLAHIQRLVSGQSGV